MSESTTLESFEYQTPGVWRRMACWLYEGMLLFGVVFIAGYLFGTLTQTRNAMDNRTALQVFIFVALSAYFVIFWTRGQTLAMKTWHIRLVDTSGALLSQQRALLRYLLSWVWVLPPLALAWAGALPAGAQALVLLMWVAAWAGSCGLAPQRQFWHDIMAGTRLVHYKPPEPAAKVAST
jgi:uncharacterized RDD family membrane protein YckC